MIKMLLRIQTQYLGSTTTIKAGDFTEKMIKMELIENLKVKI